MCLLTRLVYKNCKVIVLHFRYSLSALTLFCPAAQHLRQVGVVGKFVEFFGPGVTQLSIADRATIANMCPEYGATAAFFPVDEVSIKYLIQTGMCRTMRTEGPWESFTEDWSHCLWPPPLGMHWVRFTDFFSPLCEVKIVVETTAIPP